MATRNGPLPPEARALLLAQARDRGVPGPAGHLTGVASADAEATRRRLAGFLEVVLGLKRLASSSIPYADVLGHLATIRDEAEGLRAPRRRALFIIDTGPLMVLAVLGAV